MSINIGSREFSSTLARLLASQEGMNTAMSLQGDDALTLVDILDQVGRLDDNQNASLIPRVGFRGSKYGSRPPEKVCSYPPKSLWFTNHPSTFLHTLGEYLQGGGHWIRIWRLRGCLERASQRESCVHQGVPRLYGREPVKNQTGMWLVILRVNAPLRVAAAFVSRNRHLEAILPPEYSACTRCLPEVIPTVCHRRMDG